MSPLVQLLALALVLGLDSLRSSAGVAAAGLVDAHAMPLEGPLDRLGPLVLAGLALGRAVRRRLASRTELASGALPFLVAVSFAVGGP